MKTIVRNILFILFAITLVNCRKNTNYSFKTDPNGRPIIRLQQQWTANSGFAGELWAAALCADKDTATNYDISLQVLDGGPGVSPMQNVMLGAAEFGVAGAEQIMQANEKGSNFVVVGVINYQSLACFIAKKEKGITAPKDFVGHKIGTLAGLPVDMIYQVLKKKEKLNIPVADEIPAGWDTTGLIDDKYDVYPAFINDEPITLRLKGIDLSPPIKPSVYGIDFIGTVYFCKKELADTSPQIVQHFINAIAQGWTLAIKDPKKAIALLKVYDKAIDEKKILRGL